MAKKRRSGRPQPTNARVTPRKALDPWGRGGASLFSGDTGAGCGHPPVSEQLGQMRAQGMAGWLCAMRIFEGEDPCPSKPDWAVAWPMDVDGDPHIMVGPFCDRHHKPAVEHIGELAVVFDGASSSIGAPWSRIGDLLGEIHDPSGRGLCSAAAVTFAIVRPD